MASWPTPRVRWMPWLNVRGLLVSRSSMRFSRRWQKRWQSEPRVEPRCGLPVSLLSRSLGAPLARREWLRDGGSTALPPLPSAIWSSTLRAFGTCALMELDGVGWRRILESLADELGSEGDPIELVIAGGAAVAWRHDTRRSLDVDSIEELSDEVKLAASRVGQQHGLASDWLNDYAQVFAPAFARSECTPVMSRHRLQVLALPARALFVMKLLAARARDIEDLIVLWPDTGFASTQEAVAYYYGCYPHEDVDPHLADFIRTSVVDRLHK